LAPTPSNEKDKGTAAAMQAPAASASRLRRGCIARRARRDRAIARAMFADVSTSVI
jgi:hypothetical protein